MAWDDEPPKASELTPAKTNWDAEPPTAEELSANKPPSFLDRAKKYLGESLSLPFRGYRGLGVGIQRAAQGMPASDVVNRMSAATQPGYVPQYGERSGAMAGGAAPLLPLGVAPAAFTGGMAAGAEDLGAGKSIPEASNTAALNTAAGLVAGKVIEEGAPYLAKGARYLTKLPTKISELLTNVPASKFAKFIDNPEVVLPEILGGARGVKETGKAYEAAAKAAGFIKSAPEDAAKEGLGQFIGQKNPFSGKNAIAEHYFERLSNGEKLTPDEIFHFYQNVGEGIRPLNVHTPKGARSINLRSVLKDELEHLSPTWGAVADEYGQGKTRDAITSILPETDTGRPAFARLYGGLTGGGVAGALSHHPIAMLAGAASVSPVMHTIAYAPAAVGIKALETALKQPGVGVSILSAIQSLMRQGDVAGKVSNATSASLKSILEKSKQKK